MPSIWVLLHAHIVISGTGAFLVIYNFDFFYTQIFFLLMEQLYCLSIIIYYYNQVENF